MDETKNNLQMNPLELFRTCGIQPSILTLSVANVIKREAYTNRFKGDISIKDMKVYIIQKSEFTFNDNTIDPSIVSDEPLFNFDISLKNNISASVSVSISIEDDYYFVNISTMLSSSGKTITMDNSTKLHNDLREYFKEFVNDVIVEACNIIQHTDRNERLSSFINTMLHIYNTNFSGFDVMRKIIKEAELPTGESSDVGYILNISSYVLDDNSLLNDKLIRPNKLEGTIVYATDADSIKVICTFGYNINDGIYISGIPHEEFANINQDVIIKILNETVVDINGIVDNIMNCDDKSVEIIKSIQDIIIEEKKWADR